jgi:hypothetical protein
MLTGSFSTALDPRSPGPYRDRYVLPSESARTAKPAVKKKTAPKADAGPVPPPSVAPKTRSWLLWVLGGAATLGVIALVKKQKRRTSANPSLPRDAKKAYKAFHWGREADRVGAVQVAPRPRELVKLGTLENVTYSARKGSDPDTDYVHAFGPGKPTLAYDPRAKKLHVVGGRYRVEARGIVG